MKREYARFVLQEFITKAPMTKKYKQPKNIRRLPPMSDDEFLALISGKPFPGEFIKPK